MPVSPVTIAQGIEKRGNPSLVLPEVLRELYLKRRTGLLVVVRGEDSVNFRFVNGEVVSGASRSVRGRLGETMVRYSLLSQADLDRALLVVQKEGRRLGPVLREMGIIDTARLEQALGLHIREMLLTTLEWDEAICAFKDQELPDLPPEDLTLRASTGELILEVVRRIASPALIRNGLGDLDRALAAVPDPPFRLDHITLTPADGYVLSRIDGATAARTIIEITPLPVEEVERSLLGLLCTGVVEYRGPVRRPGPAPVRPAVPAPPREAAPPAPTPRPAPRREVSDDFRRVVEQIHARLEGRDHFQMLGLPRAATEVEAKQAYSELAKRFHPDLYEGAEPALMAKVKDIFSRMTEAHRVLSSPEERERYRAGLAPVSPKSAPPGPGPASAAPLTPPPPTPPPAPTAATTPTPTAAASAPSPTPSRPVPEAVAAAESHIAEGRHWEAVRVLEAVLADIQGALERRVRVLLARAYLMSPESARKAELEYLRLIQLDPSDVEPYLALGKFYREKGLATRARTMLEKALQARPGHKGALAELGQLGGSEPPRSDTATLFGKLLRR
jgi:tetratricopeptide (TPR) repeat protein